MVDRKDTDSVLLMACGDIGPMTMPEDGGYTKVRDALSEADIRFAQCERLYSNGGSYQVHSNGHHSRQDPKMAEIFKMGNFDVVSVASNHSMDWGPEALTDTVARFKEMGIATIGAGASIAEARTPVILERNGVTVGFLGYASVIREGYAAGLNTPGVAPLRAHTYYEPIEYQPHMPARIVSEPYEEDLAAMCDDIDALRPQVDIVVVSVHWGIHFIPKLLGDYQRIAAKAAFDHGTDLLLGHHAHLPKAIETFGENKACFYSLGNFILSAPENQSAKSLEKYGIVQDPERPMLPGGPDAKRSTIAKTTLSKNGVERVAFLPVEIDRQYRPAILHSDDPRFNEAVEYMEWLSDGVRADFKVEGDEVLVLS